MRPLAVLALAATIFSAAFAQGAKPTVRRQPVQLKVRHADPWAIKAMLEGQKIISPEISTILALMGMPPQTTQGTQGLFDDGKFLVNPNDNSLWFIPNN
ncbi:MAG: hypothetical protein BGO01_16375 [Armatimonadetes bacterium 55-13]|nr:hypothetical protein [Armatimonadota bacterium]OJU65433.1 MAG: hypothetical protein BGO01_16375 [Armatimonadetes bacterium 55-13]